MIKIDNLIKTFKNFDEKKLKRDFSFFIRDISKYNFKIMFFLSIINFILFIGYFISKKSSVILLMILCFSNIVLWIFTKDFLEEEKEQPKFFRKAKLNFTLNYLMLINHFLFLFGTIFKKTVSKSKLLGINDNINTSFIFSFLIIFLSYFFYSFFMRSESMQKTLTQIQKENFLEKFGLDVEDDLKKGDIFICTNAKTNLPVRLPYTDRFLHMLIIGPTGCGKTSQIITPMLNQDVKNLEAGVTVIEPKGDLAEKIYAMAQYYGRKAIYFNPQLEGCPSFNPLYGKEEDVIENIVTTFKMLDPDAKQYFQDMNEQLLRNALKILKRFKGNNATLIDLNTLISNPAGEGRMMVNKFMKLPAKDESEAKENTDCATYFLENYFNEKSKTYENCSGVRSQVSKITSNKFLRKVLNPSRGSDLDFEKHLEEGGVLCITTAQGKLRDLGSFLGYFIILNFQSAVFKRPGNEDTRRPHFLYIDEFQKYSNPGFADMLTQGRSYRVASHLATQARAQIGMGSGKDGDAFINLVSTNCRNVVVFPGVSYDDAKFYSDQFGEELEVKDEKGISYSEFNPIHGFQPVGYDKVTLKTKEELKARFTPTDIIYQEKQHMMFGYVKHMVVQVPVSGKIDYIPMSLNKRLNQMIIENELLMKKNLNPNECRDLTKENAPLYPEWEEKIPIFQEEIKALEFSEKNPEESITQVKQTSKLIDSDFENQENRKEILENIGIAITETGDNNDKNAKPINPLDLGAIDITEETQVAPTVIVSDDDDDDLI